MGHRLVVNEKPPAAGSPALAMDRWTVPSHFGFPMPSFEYRISQISQCQKTWANIKTSQSKVSQEFNIIGYLPKIAIWFMARRTKHLGMAGIFAAARRFALGGWRLHPALDSRATPRSQLRGHRHCSPPTCATI